MIRNLNQIHSEDYDLIIVGGGIYGAAICWEASSRGLKVALFEKSDFGSGTSANSLKIVHGGFRYLQNGAISRLKKSAREQKNLMYIAPHLVHPLPVLIPIYGHGLRGKEAFSIGLRLFNGLSSAGEQSADPGKYIPPGRIISKDSCLEQLPSINQVGLKGGGIYFDAQVYNSERLVLSFLEAAWQNGAQVANYTKVVGFIVQDRHIKGVKVKDVQSGDTFTVNSRLVILACGPWNGEILRLIKGEMMQPFSKYTKAINLITRRIFDTYAVGLQGKNKYLDGKQIPNTKNNYLFIAPWRDNSIIGTAYTKYDRSPEEIEVDDMDISFLLNVFNKMYPAGRLSQDDVYFAHVGLLPLSKRNKGNRGFSLSKKFVIRDHQNEGYQGLLSIEGIKYTTAHHVAEKAVDYVLRHWGFENVGSISPRKRLNGGEIDNFDDFLSEGIKVQSGDLRKDQIKRLIFNYGSEYKKVLAYLRDSSSETEWINQDYRLLKAQIRFAVANEMANKLGDVVFRRTELGSAGNPGEAYLQFSAQVMAKELNWNQQRVNEELEGVRKVYRTYSKN